MNRNHGLLTQLDPALRPAGTIRNSVNTRSNKNTPGGEVELAGVGQWSFDHLITLAQQGQLTTGRKITTAPEMNLTQNELSRIAAAADRVEAKGGKRAVIFSGKEMFILDVEKRRITEKIIPPINNNTPASNINTGEEIISGIDTAVILTKDNDNNDNNNTNNMENTTHLLTGLTNPTQRINPQNK